MTACALGHANGSFLFHCSRFHKAAVLVKCLEFVGNSINRGVDLCPGMVGRDEESQAGCVFGHDGIQNWLYVNTSLEQSF